MKKLWFFALLPLIFLVSGCTLIANKNNETLPLTSPALSSGSNICEVPNATSTVTATSTSKNILPPVSQEEIKKTFTYEDEEMGVKLKYPGSCFFNKGVFQCSDFTLSIWILDSITNPSSTPEITYKNGQTEMKYIFIHNNKVYALMAWYDGQNRPDLEKMIDKIAKSLTFTR